MIENTKKNQKTTKNAKIGKKNYFYKKWFFHEGGPDSSFLLLILIDILKEYLKKITKILKTPYYYVRGA